MIKSKKHLSRILGVPFKRLQYVANNIEKYYYEKEEQKFNKDGTPKLHNGQPTYRVLNPSKGVLKTIIQKRIKTRILLKIELPEYIQGGVKGKDNISNARLHKGKKFHFITDLADFFPSISNSDIFKMYKENGFSNDVSHILTKLTTYKGHLPQGAPTSTALANIMFYKIDKQISEYCDENNITYTRFVDDLSFSSDIDFREKATSIIKIITTEGFRINRKKTHYKIGSVDITGIKVKNNSLEPSDEFKKKLKKLKRNSPSWKGSMRYLTRVKNEGRKVIKKSLKHN